MRDALAGRRVLVTGAAGFMGSHLVEALLAAGATVAAVVRHTSRYDLASAHPNLRDVFERVATVIDADLAEPDWVVDASAWRPDLVYHLAAEACVPTAFRRPREVVRSNVMGTLNVLELVRAATATRLVLLSSSEVYGTHATAIDETMPTNPATPYAASKLAAEALARGYRTSYGLPILICRPFNTFGPRHVYDVIPRFIAALLAGRPLRIFGDGRQQRDFMYIADLIDGLLRAGTSPDLDGHIVNFGTGRSTSIAALAALLQEISGVRVPVLHEAPRPGEVDKLECNPAKAAALLGWKATVSLAQGLERTWSWALAHCDVVVNKDPP